MAYKFIDPLAYVDDEEEKRQKRLASEQTPSQEASQEQQEKSYKFISPDAYKTTQVQVEEPVTEPVQPKEEKKNFFQKAGDFISNIFKKDEKTPEDYVNEAIKLYEKDTGKTVTPEEKQGYMEKFGQPVSVNPIYQSQRLDPIQKENLNPVVMYNDFLNKGLLKSMEDKYTRINAERGKESPDQKKIAKWEDEIAEISASLDLPTNTAKSIPNKYKVGAKYEFQRDLSGFIADVGRLGGSLLDMLTKLGENDPTFKLMKEKAEKLEAEGKTEEAKAYREFLPEEGEQWSRKLSTKIKKWADETAPTNPDFLDKVSASTGSMGVFLVASLATGGGASAALKMSMLESASEAGSVYEENRQKGKSVEEASAEADKNFLVNMVIGYYTDKFGLLSEEATGLRKTLMSSSLEGVQEGLQQVASNMGTDRDPMEGVLESMGVGATLGGGFSVVTPSGQKIEKSGTDIVQPTEVTTPLGAGVQEEKKEVAQKEPEVSQPKQEPTTTEPQTEEFRRPETITRDQAGKFVKETEAPTVEQRTTPDGKIRTLPDFNATAEDISKVAENSFLNKPEEATAKSNRLTGEKISIQEAKTGLAQNGKDLDNRIGIGLNDNGNLIITDGRHLLEAYRSENLELPSRKVYFESVAAENKFNEVVKGKPQETEQYYHGSPSDRLSVSPDGIYLSPLTESGKNYSRAYTLKSGGGGTIRTVSIPKNLNIFDFSNPQHKQALQNAVSEQEFASYERAARGGQLDWSSAPDVEVFKELGFDGTRLFERPAGHPAFDETGKTSPLKEDVISTLIFDAKNVTVVEEKSKVSPQKEPEVRRAKRPVAEKPTRGVDSSLSFEMMAEFSKEIPVGNVDKVQVDTKGIDFPELLDIVEKLGIETPTVATGKKRKMLGDEPPLGFFSHNDATGEGKIVLNPEIFKDTELATKVLSHEMGHLIDWLPSKTLARGNLLGRLTSLSDFTRETFSGLKAELKVDSLVKEQAKLQQQRRDLRDKEGNLPEKNKKEDSKVLAKLKKVNAEIKKLRSDPKYKNEVVLNELKAWTRYWTPFVETLPEKLPDNLEAKRVELQEQLDKYIEYRDSGKELYAEALSGLLANPTALKEKAPTFYKGFFEYLDQKPSVKQALYETYNLLTDSEAKLSKRQEKLLSDFQQGEDGYRMLLLDKAKQRLEVKTWLKNAFLDKNSALIDKVNEAKKKGEFVPDEKNPQYFLEGINYVDGKVASFLEERYQPIWDSLRENNLSWEKHFGEYLFYERVINERGAATNPAEHLKSVWGEETWAQHSQDLPKDIEKLPARRQLEIMEKVWGQVKTDINGSTFWEEAEALLPLGIANPRGFDTKTATEQKEFLKSKLSDSQWKAMEKAFEDFQSANKAVLKMAEDEGLYNKELIKEMKANPAYATFQVLDYLNTYIPSTIKRQVGTLKAIASPSTPTVMKNISIIKAVERNKAIRSVVEFYKEHFPTEIKEAKYLYNGRYQVPVEPKSKNEALITYMDNGKFVGYYVDKYIAESVDFWGTPTLRVAGQVLRTMSGNKFYRPLFITFNLGFQSFNAFRDGMRFYKNVPSIKFWQVLKVPQRYIQAIKPAFRRAWDIPDATIQEMQKSKILGITYNDVIHGATEEDTQMARILTQYDLLKDKKQRNNFMKPVLAILDTIERTGNMIETLPKVAGYLELQGKMPNEKLASFIRTSVGSPDFLRKGTWYPVYNEVFLFSNAIKEGIRSDLAIATQPETRSGYWTKTMMVTVLPKMIMAAALYGALGDELKKMLENVSEYNMSNYIIVPLGVDENGKTVYLRVPQDETGRLWGAIFWKAITAPVNDQNLGKDLQDIFGFVSGQLPTTSPTLALFRATHQFLVGENPYDYFRGQNVLTDEEFKAGGTYALKPFLMWAFQSVGGNVVMSGHSTYQSPETRTWVQNVVNAPMLSNILGRWVKVSDYGQTEKLKKVKEDVEREAAREKIERDNRLESAIKEYRSGEQTQPERQRIVEQLVKDVYGNPPYDSTTQGKVTRLVNNFKLGIIKGESDAKVNALIYANTNEEKVALLKAIKEDMEKDEFKGLLEKLLNEKIISPTVLEGLSK